jgi:hypothetical protein
MKYTLTILAAVLSLSTSASADCVVNAKAKLRFQVLDSHTILFTGGGGSDFIVKTFAFVTRGSDIRILKDDFCSHDSAVLYIDGEVADARQVTKL